MDMTELNKRLDCLHDRAFILHAGISTNGRQTRITLSRILVSASKQRNAGNRLFDYAKPFVVTNGAQEREMIEAACHFDPRNQHKPSKSFQSMSGRNSQRVIRPLVTVSIFAAKATPGCRSLLEIKFVRYVRLMPHRVAMARRSAGLSDLKKAVACSFMEINTL
jgi:hypothetical protein